MFTSHSRSVSGAHYNPALTLAFYICGDRKSPNPIIYVLVALAGSVCATLLTWGLDGFAGGLPVMADGVTGVQWARWLVCEFLGAALTVYNVMYVALLARPPLGNHGPIVVALGFFAAILAFRDHGGAVLNPALCFGLWVAGLANGVTTNAVPALFAYLGVELLGAMCGGLVARGVLEMRKTKAQAKDNA